MKKIFKMINLTLVIIILLSIITPVFNNLLKAATYNVTYNGKVKYGKSTVGDFMVDGARAFCIDHVKPTPPTGAVTTKEIYNNTDIAKCLYYGWGGAEQWGGFENEAHGIVATSLALDYYNNGNLYNDGKSFIDYLETVDMPEILLEFSNKNLTAYIEGNIQRTQSVTVNGDSRYSMSIKLQNGVTLVNETKNTEKSGTVGINGGDSFYLKAPLSFSGSWTSENIDNCKYIFQPIIYRTQNTSYQDLAGKLQVQADPGTTTNLSVDWVDKGYIEINKYDISDNSKLKGVKFGIFDTQKNLIETLTTNEQGYIKSSALNLQQYIVKELETLEGYVLDKTEYKVDLAESASSGNYIYTLNVGNEAKKGNLVIYKVDEFNKPIPDTEFDIYNSKNKYIATVRTDSTGVARLNNIRTDSYTIVEKSVNEYYRLDTTKKILNVKYANESGDSNITITNKMKKGYIEINKYDKEAFEKYNRTLGVSNVVFGIFDEQGNKIQEITTDAQGYAKSGELRIDKNYIVKELSTRPEYIINETEYNVDLTREGIIDRICIFS